MNNQTSDAEIYADIIIEDDLSRIAYEETLVHEDSYIVREYEIDDGAVVKYEWRGFPGKGQSEMFNHRFTLIKPPAKNKKVQTGVIKEIGFSR